MLAAAPLIIGLVVPFPAAAVPITVPPAAVPPVVVEPLVDRRVPQVTSAALVVRRYTMDLVLARTPSGRSDATTLADLRAAVRNVDAFYSRNTGGRIRFVVGRTHGWSRSTRACSISVPRSLASRRGWKVSARRIVSTTSHVLAFKA